MTSLLFIQRSIEHYLVIIMEQSLKRQIVNAAEAVKKKVKLMRNIDIDNKQMMESIFKPVTEPLNLFANANNHSLLRAADDERSKVPFTESIMQKRIVTPESNIAKDSNLDESQSDNESDSSYQSIVESNQGCDSSSWSVSSEALADVPFGVRLENGKLMLGSARITIDDENIVVAGRKYQNTLGIKQLLLKKDIDLSVVTDTDLQNYKSMLLNTNAHRRDYDPSKPIKSNKGQKYLQVVKPLFKLQTQHKGKGLPLIKTWKTNIDYVYWDDPNELVERLKLLIASRDAGNTGLDNEIISIIEELRESKIINT